MGTDIRLSPCLRSFATTERLVAAPESAAELECHVHKHRTGQ